MPGYDERANVGAELARRRSIVMVKLPILIVVMVLAIGIVWQLLWIAGLTAAVLGVLWLMLLRRYRFIAEAAANQVDGD